MTNGGRNLNVATETEKQLALALIALAGAVFAGVVTLFAAGPLSGLSPNGSFYATIVGILIFLLLLLSVIFGGRGIAYGPGRRGLGDRFNLQASSGAIAILLIMVLAFIIHATTEPSTDKLRADVEATTASLKTDLVGLKSDLAALQNREGAFETSIGGKLDELSRTTQALSQRIEKLEANAKQPKP